MNTPQDITGMKALDRTLQAAVILFVVAALSGALFRLAGVYGWTLGLDALNVRHAHSHLMYFGWVTPVLFVLAGREARARGVAGPSPALLAWVVGLSLLAWVTFLFWGYDPVSVGRARIPASIIVSTAIMFTWYGWAAWYRKARVVAGGLEHRMLWDAAVWFLILSTAGAWGVAALLPAGDALATVRTALAHLFLGWFAEGWFVLALLGLIWRVLPGNPRVPRWALAAFVGGTVLSFLLGMPGYASPPALRFAARVGGVAWGVGAIGLAWAWWKRAPAPARRAWGLAVAVLALKASSQAASAFVPGIWWADLAPVRVLYLHVLLLGFVTPALAAGLVRGWRLVAVQAALAPVVIALVPLTDLWPSSLAPDEPLKLAAWVSVVLPLAALSLLRRSYPSPA